MTAHEQPSLVPGVTTHPSITPSGIEVNRTDKVDIYPLSPSAGLVAKPGEIEIPIAMDKEAQDNYRSGLIKEGEFLAGKLKKTVPPLPESGSVEEYHGIFAGSGLGKIGIREIALKGGDLIADYAVVPFPAYTQFSQHSNPSSVRLVQSLE